MGQKHTQHNAPLRTRELEQSSQSHTALFPVPRANILYAIHIFLIIALTCSASSLATRISHRPTLDYIAGVSKCHSLSRQPTMSSLPEVIRIDDVSSGKIDPALIYNELDRLKVEINLLRGDMASFVKAIATIPQGTSPTEYQRHIYAQLKQLQQHILSYCAEYNKLLPIINLSQIRLGHDVEIAPTSSKDSITSTFVPNGAQSVPNGKVDSPAVKAELTT